MSKAAKKSDRSTKEGRVITFSNNKIGVILELNCETDFVANNENFIQLGKTIAQTVADNDVTTVEGVKELDHNGSKVSELIS